MTAKQIIEGALRIVGALASGEEGTPSELQDGLSALNSMIGAWNNESLMIPALTTRTFALSGKASFTYGPGGDFNAPVPIGFEYAQFKDPSGFYFGCPLYGVRQYAENIVNTVMRPAGVYFQASYPLATVNFTSTPLPTDTFVVRVLEPITSVAFITDDLALPPGYDRALKFNLAVELSAEFGGTLKQEVVAIAEDSKHKINIKNTRVNTLTFDFTTSQGFYNINQGPVK